MNNRPILAILLVATLSFTSCKKELQPQESSTDTTAVANATAVNPTAVTPAPVTPTQAQPNQPVQINPQQMQTTSVQPAQPAKTAKGMNPPHGQPNHRCDIAVGAPLNSPPGKTAPQTTQTVTPTTVQKGLPNSTAPVGVAAPATSTPVVTAPGMNPPHGQAGHDCAVAVGAPLPKK